MKIELEDIIETDLLNLVHDLESLVSSIEGWRLDIDNYRHKKSKIDLIENSLQKHITISKHYKKELNALKLLNYLAIKLRTISDDVEKLQLGQEMLLLIKSDYECDRY